jgi:hypothetical protein
VSESTTPAAAPAVVSPSAASADDEHAVAVVRMRRSSLGVLFLLVVQSILGMCAALYGRLPHADKGKGLLASFGNATAKGPAAVAAHAGFGMLLFIAACLAVVFGLTVRYTAVRAASVLGWLCIAGAAVSGAASVNAGGAKADSLTMAILTFVAMACYGVNLYVLGEKR